MSTLEIQIAEFVGTFIFIFSIFAIISQPSVQFLTPFAIALALFISICISQSLSSKAKAHLNPAVSFTSIIGSDGQLNFEIIGLIIVQVFAGLCAYGLFTLIKKMDVKS